MIARFRRSSLRSDRIALRGTGPRTAKLGGRVVYAVADLSAWVGRGERTSTSDDTGDHVRPAQRRAAIAPAYLRKARS